MEIKSDWMVKTVVLLQQQKILSFLIILSLAISCIPINQIIQLSNDRLSLENSDIVDTPWNDSVHVTKLMKKKSFSNLSNSSTPGESSSEFPNSSSVGDSIPKFSLGSQSGTGGGSVTIRDSFNWTGTEIINTTNKIYGLTGLPTLQADSVSIQDQTEFQLQYKYFNLSTIQSEYDWRLIEDKSVYTGSKNSKHISYDGTGGDMWMVIAISFEITEDYANLSSVMTYHDNSLVSGVPNGKLWIEGCSNGQPDGNKIAGTEQSLLSGDTWNQYDFDQILLSKGEYFVIMKDFDNTTGYYFIWEATRDDATPIGDGTNTSKVLVRYPNFNFTWVEPDGISYDAPLQIRVKPVEADGSAKKYSLENDVKIWYNTSANGGSEVLLDSTSWFKANDTSTHLFKSNTSVSFDLTFVANYTSPQPIDGVSTYRAQNETVTNWNITFSTLEANQTYAVTNRHISLTTIPADWNGSKIYWNTTLEYPSLTTDVNVTWDGDPTHKYTHGNTTMVVNASTLAVNTTWHVWWDAPNYLLAFNLSRGGTELALPYEANVTDILDLEFEVPEIGGNISYWIEYYGADIQKNLNFDTSNFLITDSWDINASVSQTTNVNGTYGLQGFWINSDETKVGTITRSLDVYTATTFTINSTDSIEVVIGEKITIWANYTSNHNSTLSDLSHIKNAKTWCNASWPITAKQNVTMNQPTGTYYNASFTTDDEAPGTSGTITITTQLRWFVNWTKTINIKFVGESSLTVNETNISLKWHENTTLRIYYNDTLGDPIESATIIVNEDDTNPAGYDPGSGAYHYRLNSTQYEEGVGDYFNLPINASHPNYVSKEITFTLSITPADSSIDDASVNPDNYPLDITNGSTFYFWVIWLSEYGNPLNDSDGVGISHSDVTLDVTDPSVGNHTFKFVPTVIGPIDVTLTFQTSNYHAATFHINVTSIESTNLAVNKTIIVLNWRENITLEMWYNDSFSNPIKDATIIVDGDTVHPAVYNSGTRTYYYRLNSTHYGGVGDYLNLNITAQRIYYQNQSLFFNLTITPADSSIGDASVNPDDYPLDVTNGSTFYFWVTWLSKYGDPLNDSDGVGISHSDVTLDATDPSVGNHTFKFIPTTIGPINVTLIFQTSNYHAAIFHLNVTSIESTNLAVNETIIVLNWQENTTLEMWYNDSFSNPIEDATIIVDGDTAHPAVYHSGTGTYYYRLNSTHYNGVGDYLNLNITAQRTYYQNQTLFFNLTITPADSSIGDASVNPADYPLDVTNRSAFYFWVIWLSEHGDPLNDSDGVGISHSDVTLDVTNPSVGNHTFKLVPTTIGPINVTLTFQTSNYHAAIFHLNVTSIENTNLAVNETIIVLNWRENTTLQIWYNDSVNKPIEEATIIIDGDAAHPAVYHSGTEAYYYQLNSTHYSGVGDYLNLNITAQRTYYQNQTLFFNLTITPADSSIGDASVNPADYPLDVTNGSAFYFWVIWLSEYGDPLNDSDGVGSSSSDVILISTSSLEGNHTFKLVPTTIGPIDVTLTFQTSNYYAAIFHLNVTSIESTSLAVNKTIIVLNWRENTTLEMWYNDSFSNPIKDATIIVDGDTAHPAVYHSGTETYYYQLNSTHYGGVGDYLNLNITAQGTYYQNQTLYFNLTITPADSSIDDASANPVDYPFDVINGTAFYFWVIWLSEYGDPLNDSDGVEISHPDVTLDVTDPSAGNHTFKFVPTTIGPINVTLAFQTSNYHVAIFHLNVTSIESTSLTVNETTIVLSWRENTTLQIWYNNSFNNPIEEAMIIVDGDTAHPAVYNSGTGAYSYQLNSTHYGGVGDYLNLNITAQRTYHQNQTLYFNLTITPADSSIDDASVNPTDYPLEVTNGSTFYFWVIWLSKYGDPLNDSDGVGISHPDVALDVTDPSVGNHTFEFVPTTIGPINVTLTFQTSNYHAAIFHINVTSIESTNLAVNETIIILNWRENTTLEMWYNDSFNNPIKDATIIIDGDAAHLAVYNSGTGAYYYRLNSTHYGGVGDYLNLNITAERTYYQNQTLFFNLTITPADSSIDDASVNPVDYPIDITNGSAFYFWVIWFSEYGDPLNDTDGVGISHPDVTLDATDPSVGNHTFEFVPTTIGPINVTLTFQTSNYHAAIFHLNVTSIESTSLTVNETTIVLSWRENTTLQIWYNNSANTPIEGAAIIVDGDVAHPAVYNSGTGTYYYRLNSTHYNGVGDYLNLNITAQRTYHQNQTLYFNLIITPADSSIDDASVNPADYPLEVTNGSTFYFWIIWLSEYGDPLNDSDGVDISHLAIIMDSTNAATGNHTFKFVPTTVGPINVTLSFQISNYYAVIFHLNVTSIESTSLAVNETTIVLNWRENTTLQMWYNDSFSNPIEDATIIVNGDVAHPAVYHSGTGAYYYQLNSTHYSGVGEYLNLNITAQRTYNQNQTLYFNLTITPADSSIGDASINPADFPLDVTNGTTFYFWVIWLSEYGDPLNDSDGVGSSSSDVILNSTSSSAGNHTFKFIPTAIGPINVTLTFQISNYHATTFHINVTSIESTSLAVNETIIVLNWRENTTLEMWYNDSFSNPIEDATIIVDRDTAHPAVYNSGTGAYYYRLNSTHYNGVGDYLNLNITAERTYYQNQTLYFNLTITPADSSIDDASVNPVDYPLDITNGSAFYFWVIWRSEYDDPLNDSDGVGISHPDVTLDVTDPLTGNHTFKFVPTVIGAINVTLTFQTSNYHTSIFHINVTSIESTSLAVNETIIVLNWRENTTLEMWYNDSFSNMIEDATIIVDGNEAHPAVYNSGTGAYYYRLNSTHYGGVGDYLNLNITAERTYYQNQTLFFNLTITPADSSIDDASVNPVDYPIDITNGSAFYFWVIWLSEYDDPLNDSDGVGISHPDVTLDVTDPLTGNHTFKFVPTTIGPINVTLAFQTSNYHAAIFHLNVISIENTSLIANATIILLSWRENTTLKIWYNNSANIPIQGATLIIAGDVTNPAIYDSDSGVYYYLLNSTYFGVVGEYFNINITAQKTYHITRIIFFDLTINLADTKIENMSIKPFPELNDVPSNESFELWIIWQSEYDDFLNASDGVLINGTLNSHPDIFIYDTDASTGNHSFIFYYSGTSILTYNLTFIIENYNKLDFLIRFNVHNSTMLIDDKLSNPKSGQTIDFLQYGEVFYFNVFINDSKTKSPLNTTILFLPKNIVFLDYTAEGNHSFKYNASQIGIYSDLIIIFTLQNYNRITYNISFLVSPREIILDSNRSTQQSIDYLHYGDIFYFFIYLNDSRTREPLNISRFNNLHPNFNFENFSLTKGHLFRYQALERGDFIYEINFTKQYYNDYIHTLIFNITKADSELIPSSDSITTYYLSNTSFSLIWQSIPNPYVNTSLKLKIMNTSSINIQPLSSGWENNIILQSIENGNYSFKVIADRVGTVVIRIHLYSDNYNPVPISIDIPINIIPLPTYEPQISYPLELIVGEALIISCDQWLSINNNSVPIDELLIFNDSLSIEYTLIDMTEFSFIITIDTEDFRQGFHNFTLKISSYGHKNHSISIPIELIGREILIEIKIFPTTLTQGSNVTIKATLTYAILQTYSGFGSGLSLAPLEGIPVSFSVKIKYENDTTKPFYFNTTTNASGEAEFTIIGKYTLLAEGIESITVTSAATASGKSSTQSTPPNFFETHKFEKKTIGIPGELIILGIMTLVFAIILISPIGIYRTRKRKQKKKIAKDLVKKVTPEPAPEGAPRVKMIEEIIQSPIEDVVKSERIEALIKEPKEKILEIEEQQIQPSSWITQFPPIVSECEKEIIFLFDLVMKREGRWHGRTSYNFLLKHKTDDISVAKIKKIYMILPQQTTYFEKEKTSIVITEEGKRIASTILKNDDKL